MIGFLAAYLTTSYHSPLTHFSCAPLPSWLLLEHCKHSLSAFAFTAPSAQNPLPPDMCTIRSLTSLKLLLTFHRIDFSSIALTPLTLLCLSSSQHYCLT